MLGWGPPQPALIANAFESAGVPFHFPPRVSLPSQPGSLPASRVCPSRALFSGCVGGPARDGSLHIMWWAVTSYRGSLEGVSSAIWDSGPAVGRHWGVEPLWSPSVRGLAAIGMWCWRPRGRFQTQLSAGGGLHRLLGAFFLGFPRLCTALAAPAPGLSASSYLLNYGFPVCLPCSHSITLGFIT